MIACKSQLQHKITKAVDCGLFAIAVMTSLAHKEDPSVVSCDKCIMRQHLLECFSTKLVIAFPKS